jgi:hypothetical protein
LLEWQEGRGDMDISEVNSGLERVSLPGDQKKAILLLIDANNKSGYEGSDLRNKATGSQNTDD